MQYLRNTTSNYVRNIISDRVQSSRRNIESRTDADSAARGVKRLSRV